MPTKAGTTGISINTSTSVELFHTPLFHDITKADDFRVIPNVVNRKNLGFASNLKKIVQKAVGCGFTPKGQASIFERTIETQPIKVNIEQCFDQFEGTALESELKKGNSKYDLRGTKMMKLLIDLVRNAMPIDLTNLFWFGDTSSTDVFYCVTDGIWTVYLEPLALAGKIPYTNTGSGAPLAPGDAMAYLQSVKIAQPLALKGLIKSSKRFYVSDSIWEGYYEDLKTVGGGDASRVQVINGIDTLFYDGIKLVPNANWDQITSVDFGQPDKHMILLTIPENLVMATDLKSSFNAIDVFYDWKEENVALKVNAKFGTNYVHEAFFSVGY